jgi:hypothetical protein
MGLAQHTVFQQSFGNIASLEGAHKKGTVEKNLKGKVFPSPISDKLAKI